MSQSAESGAAVVRNGTRLIHGTVHEYQKTRLGMSCSYSHARVPKLGRNDGGGRGHVSYVTKVFMEDMLLANYTD